MEFEIENMREESYAFDTDSSQYADDIELEANAIVAIGSVATGLAIGAISYLGMNYLRRHREINYASQNVQPNTEAGRVARSGQNATMRIDDATNKYYDADSDLSYADRQQLISYNNRIIHENNALREDILAYRRSLADLEGVTSRVGEAGDDVGDSWSHTWFNHYSTRTSTDSEGNTTFEQVYDYTSHYWKYRQEEAAAGIEHLQDELRHLRPDQFEQTYITGEENDFWARSELIRRANSAHKNLVDLQNPEGNVPYIANNLEEFPSSHYSIGYGHGMLPLSRPTGWSECVDVSRTAQGLARNVSQNAADLDAQLETINKINQTVGRINQGLAYDNMDAVDAGYETLNRSLSIEAYDNLGLPVSGLSRLSTAGQVATSVGAAIAAGGGAAVGGVMLRDRLEENNK